MKKNLLMILLAIPFISINVFADAPVARAVDVVDNPNAKTEFLAEASKWNVSPFNKSGYYVEVLEATCSSSVNSITLLNSDVKRVLACENGNTNPYLLMIGDGSKDFASGTTCADTTGAPYAYATRIYTYDCNYTGTNDSDKTEYGGVLVDAQEGLSFTKEDVEGNITTVKNTGTSLNVTCSGTGCKTKLSISVGSGYKYRGMSLDNCSTIIEESVGKMTPTITFNSGSTSHYYLCSTKSNTGTTDNKDTGVEDYFIALGTIGVVVTCLFYFVDKKKVFRKI